MNTVTRYRCIRGPLSDREPFESIPQYVGVCSQNLGYLPVLNERENGDVYENLVGGGSWELTLVPVTFDASAKQKPGRKPKPIQDRAVTRSIRLHPSDWALIDQYTPSEGGSQSGAVRETAKLCETLKAQANALSDANTEVWSAVKALAWTAGVNVGPRDSIISICHEIAGKLP